MIKKYEIINDGGKKRIKALRSFHVQGRYVNIGDVGGIVYDENTLSQEGNGWIFSGNLNYPSIRVSGDSIVDTNGYEAEVTDPRPFVNITGTSALIGAHYFVTEAAAAKTLAVSDVEQGSATSLSGSTYEDSKTSDAETVRLKNPLYCHTASTISVVCDAGYKVSVLCYDKREKLIYASDFSTEVNVTDKNPAYIAVLVKKTDEGNITPADIVAANVRTSKLSIEAYLDINDSRLEFQYTSAMTVATKVNPGSATSDVRKSVIDTSNVVISKTGGGAFGARIYADITQCNVAFTTVNAESTLAGTFENVKNLTYDGTFLGNYSSVLRKNLIVSGCDNFALSTGTITPTGVSAANVANMPFVFTRCNVPNGIFYHNAKAKNIYTDIDFEKALTDLSEPLANADLILVSGEKQGMYRVVSKSTRAMGPLVEDIHSVKNLNLTAVGANTQSVEIYKDAYLEGAFTLEGSQVYGGSFGHDRSTDLKPHMVAVRGAFNTQVVGQIITGTVENKNTMIIAAPVRVNGPHGMEIGGLSGSGVTATLAFTDIRGKIAAVDAHSNDVPKLTEDDVKFHQAYITFSKEGSPVTEDDLKGIVIRTFNGCKVVNTKEAAAVVKGDVRVENNAAVYDSPISGSGYFGGNSVTENAAVVGSICVADNGVFAPVPGEGKPDSDIRIVDNAKFLAASRSMNTVMHMDGNSEFSGTIAADTLSIVMHDRSRMAGSVSGRGLLILEDDADTSDKGIGAYGIIRLVGNYRQTGEKIWTGNRTIGSESEPTYENNVKTKYDF